jgi:hypothetical protein
MSIHNKACTCLKNLADFLKYRGRKFPGGGDGAFPIILANEAFLRNVPSGAGVLHGLYSKKSVLFWGSVSRVF